MMEKSILYLLWIIFTNKGLLTLEFDFENHKRNNIIDLCDAEYKLKETYNFISNLI